MKSHLYGLRILIFCTLWNDLTCWNIFQNADTKCYSCLDLVADLLDGSFIQLHFPLSLSMER